LPFVAPAVDPSPRGTPGAGGLPTLAAMQIAPPHDSAGWRRWFHHEPQDPRPWPWGTTLAAAAAIALAFTIVGFVLHASGEGAWRNWRGWLQWYGLNLVIALCASVSIRTLFALLVPLIGVARIQRFSNLQRALFFSGVPLLGVAIGAPLGMLLTGQQGRVWINLDDGNAIAGTLLISTLISTIFFLIFSAKARAVQAEKRAAEAQLRLLQGQIEPHFLFNTLANVTALIDHDAAKAKAMLESFTDYLRASLGSLRGDSSTLGHEIGLVQAYLNLLKTRMEDRLTFDIERLPALDNARLPALLLQPLVENAVHHGLEPKVDGGHVSVRARLDGAVLVLEVTDDGLGLPAAAARRRKGNGMALANLRERLQAQYGSAASLTLEDHAPGTRATLRIPHPTTP